MVVGFLNYQAKIISLQKEKVNIMHKRNMQNIALKDGILLLARLLDKDLKGL